MFIFAATAPPVTEVQAVDKLKALSLGEKIVAIAAILLFIDGFLPWYKAGGGSVSIGGVRVFHVPTVTRSGWESPGAFFSIVAILLALAMVAILAIRVFGAANLPEKVGSLGWGLLYFIAGAFALLLVVLKWLNEHDAISYGFWIGLACTLGLAAGGYLIAAERGEMPPIGNTRPAAGPGPGPAGPPV